MGSPQRRPFSRCAHGHLFRDLLPAGIAFGDAREGRLCYHRDRERKEIEGDGRSPILVRPWSSHGHILPRISYRSSTPTRPWTIYLTSNCTRRMAGSTSLKRDLASISST